MNRMHLVRWKWRIVILLTPVLVAAEEKFQADLHRIKFQRQRDKESLIAMDKVGEDLLRRYQQPGQQGEIYYYLAHQHAQGGLLFPDKVIDYACKALECSVTPDQKMRLYVYRGDASQILDRKKPFMERRRDAVISYLRGLKDLKSFQLPDKPPIVPNDAPFPSGPRGSAEKTRKAQQQFEEARQQYLEARERAEFTRTMMKHRDVLQGQIVSMYARRPLATEELKETATSFLGEGKELDRLMAAVNDKIAKLPPEVASPSPIPIEAPAPTVSSKHLYLSIVIGAGAFMSAVILLLSRWRRSRRQMESGSAQ